MGSVIRAYELKDLDEVLGVWQASARAAYPFWNPERFERERREIAGTHLAAAETYVFERDGGVVGFISMLGHEVGGLFVTQEAQGQGIGRALLDHVRPSRDFLELDVFEANQSARGFYNRYGFEEVGGHTDEAGLRVLRLRLAGRRPSPG